MRIKYYLWNYFYHGDFEHNLDCQLEDRIDVITNLARNNVDICESADEQCFGTI